jgi:prepilin-type N-terminal cleavage/methylation domain-containing protein
MRKPARRGMTLIEIMIALVLLGIVGGVIMRVITRQQRFYMGVNQIMSQRGQLRQATTVLPIDLRSLSSIGDDIKVATDSSLEFNLNIGTGVVCEVVNGTTLSLTPATLANGQRLTSWFGYGPPALGSTVFVYNDSSTLGNEDDRWQKFTLAGLDSNTSRCAPGTGTITSASDNAAYRYNIQLSSTDGTDPVTGGPISQYIAAGAPVRIMKRVRYDFFQHTDGKWYLGYSVYNTGSSTYPAPSPVSGPYDPFGTTPGLSFKYFDVDGAAIASGADSASRSRIARVDLIVRARTAANVKAVGIQGGANQQYQDSLAVSVMLRNRN